MKKSVPVLALLALAACTTLPQNVTFVDQVLHKLDVGLSEEERKRIDDEIAAAKAAEAQRKEDERIAKLTVRASTRVKPDAFKDWKEKDYQAHGISRLRFEQIGVIPVKEYEDMLNRIYVRLKLASGVNAVPGRVYVTADTALSAVALPDNNVTVSLGYLKNLESEDAVAALLAHELSHVVLGHTRGSFLSRDIEKLQSKLNKIEAKKRQFERESQQPGTYGNYSQGPQKVGVGKNQQNLMHKLDVTRYTLQHFVDPITKSGDEEEADRLALDLLLKAGFSSEGMFDWLNLVHNWEMTTSKSTLQQQEPELLVRMTDRMFKERSVVSGFVNTLTKGEYRSIRTTALAMHPEVQERRDKLNEYFDLNPEPVKPIKRTALFSGNANLKRQAQTKLNEYEQLVLAVEAYVANDKARSEQLVQQLKMRKSPALQLSTAQLLQGRQAADRNQYADAMRLLTAATDDGQVSWEAYRTAVFVLRDAGRHQEVEQWMNSASVKFNHVERIQPHKIDLWLKLNRPDRAIDDFNHCLVKMPAMRGECEDAINGKFHY